MRYFHYLDVTGLEKKGQKDGDENKAIKGLRDTLLLNVLKIKIMRNKQLFQNRLNQLDTVFTTITNGINLGHNIGEIKSQIQKGKDIVEELKGYVENEQ